MVSYCYIRLIGENMKINLPGGYTLNIDIAKMQKDTAVPSELREALAVIEKYGVRGGASAAQKDSAVSASRVREERKRQEISAVISSLLNYQGFSEDQITAYRVSKSSGCAYNTAKKYVAMWKNGELDLVPEEEEEIPFDIPIEENN